MSTKHEFSKRIKKEIEDLQLKSNDRLGDVFQLDSSRVKIIECPRDAMQGIKPFISTKKKAIYINALLKVGFDIIDFGSFVSPKAIPQMKDTADVLKKLDMHQTTTKLLAIIGNGRGAEEAAQYEQISYLGFPFSVSETFLQRNLNTTIRKCGDTVSELLEICDKKGKELVVYISMGFGNPYGDEWNVDLVAECVRKLYNKGVRIIPLSDTIGSSNVMNITNLFSALIPAFPDVEFGFHLHTSIRHWYRKVNAAYENGCRRFDTVINGLGGCPMAEEGQLVGNLKTSNLLEFLEIKGLPTFIDEEAFLKVFMIALKTFPSANSLGSWRQG